jgi:hypothetical protein
VNVESAGDDVGVRAVADFQYGVKIEGLHRMEVTDMGSVIDMRRLVESLRREVEMLRAERIELLAQLRFATEQANRETIEAAWLEKELAFARESIGVAHREDRPGESTAVLPTPWLKALTSRSRHRADDTLVDVHTMVD